MPALRLETAMHEQSEPESLTSILGMPKRQRSMREELFDAENEEQKTAIGNKIDRALHGCQSERFEKRR